MLTLLTLFACLPNETILNRTDTDSAAEDSADVVAGAALPYTAGFIPAPEAREASSMGKPGRTADRAAIKWAWLGSSEGEDRSSAIAAADDGGMFVANRVGVGMEPSTEFGSQLTRLDENGTVVWNTVIANARDGVELHTILPTDDGGAWACGMLPGFARLLPDVGAVPDEWRASFILLRFDVDGAVSSMRALGSPHDAEISAGCGMDDSGRVIVDGSVAGGPLELLLEDSWVMLPMLADRGFVMVIEEDGAFGRVSTWDANSVRRADSVVQPDGTVVQLIRYSGVPGVDSGTEHLAECPEEQVCNGLLNIDASGSMEWVASLGSTIGQSVTMAPTADFGFVMAMAAAEGAVLPSADYDDLSIDFTGSVVARYDSGMNLQWLQDVGPGIVVQDVAEGDDGQTMLAMWTGTAETVSVGERERSVARSAGTIALATLDEDGVTDWLWAASGPGSAWPTAMNSVDGDFLMTGVVRGALAMDAGGPTATMLQSMEDEDGMSTGDMMVSRIGMRRR